MSLKIAQFGFGKTGKEIKNIIEERGHLYLGYIDSNTTLQEKSQLISAADIAIDFSRPNAVLENIDLCIKYSTQLVMGTTGWYNQLELFKEKVQQSAIGFIYSGNFSPGVNILFELNIKLAKIMNDYPNYQSSIHEIHHTEKLDAPSGTAIELANQIIGNHNGYNGWELGNYQEFNSNQNITISHERLQDEKGTHYVIYQNEIDQIQLMHKALNRKGFALGAVLAAEFIANKKGIFNSRDLYNFN